jgi:hypothetical protein
MQIPKLLTPRVLGSAVAGLGLCLLTGSEARAGTFTSDFTGGIPAGLNIYGSATAYDHTSGGNTGGCLKLTSTDGSQNSGMWIDDLDAGQTIGGFDATFDLYIGSGNGADGFSFYFGDFADNAGTSEEGPTITGLTVVFDVYNNGGTPAEAPAIDVKWDGVTVFHRLVGATGTATPASPLGTATTIRSQATTGGAAVWWPVKIHADTDGTLDVVYNNVVVVSNLPVFRALTAAPTRGPAYRFGMGARTGGSTDNHWVDNLNITTVPQDARSGQPFLSSIQQVPVGANAGAAGGVVVEMTDGTAQDGVTTYSVDQAKVTMKYGANTVTPVVTRAGSVTRIAYFGTGGVLPAGKVDVNVGYETTSAPAAANNFTWTFVVDPFQTLGTNYAIASVDTTKPGFKFRVHQMADSIRAPGDRNLIVLAERELALGYLDPATGQPYQNVADLSQVGADGFFTEPGVINFNWETAEQGNFRSTSTPSRPEKPWPGIPGSSLSTDNFVVEFLTILQLKAGGQRFGFNSDDGFRASFGLGWDAASPSIAGSFNGGRGAADSLFDVVVPADGYYPVRISYWQGTGGGNAEFFWMDPTTGQKVLVNDPDNLNAPRAYAASAVARPSIARVLPVQNWLYAFPDEDVIIDVRNEGFALNAGSVALYINDVLQSPTITPSGSVTTIRRPGSLTNLLPSGRNNVRLEYGYTDNGNPVTVTNTYGFDVAPYYGIVPPANKVAAADVTGVGFTVRVNQIDRSRNNSQGEGARLNGGDDANRMPGPEVQFADGNINPTNGLPYPNLSGLSPDNNFTFNIIDFINYNVNNNSGVLGAGDSGFFTGGAPNPPLLGAHGDAMMPWLPGTGTSDAGRENFVAEIQTFLDLKRGVYVFGFNSDDGYVAISAPSANDTLGTLLGFANYGKGNTGNIRGFTGANPPRVTPYSSQGGEFFSVIILEDGIYPIRILYWQGGTGVNAEFLALNRTNGTVLLINDVGSGDPAAITAYATYSGPARPWVRHSVSPNPWSGGYQMAGPGPIKFIGRTRNAANAGDIYNINNRDWARAWPDVAIGGVIANGASDPNIKLLVNGAEVQATKTTTGNDVTVSYQPNPPLPPYSTNTASLVYAGTTNSWTFRVLNWTTLNASDAQPLTAANPASRGFRVKMTQVATIPAGVTQNSVARAEDQLAGIIGPNLAFPGSGPDGSYIYSGIINWNNNFQTNVTPAPNQVPIGNFQGPNSYDAGTGWPFPFYADEPLPGVPGTGRSNVDNAAAEVFAYLALPTAGLYRFAVNSDDGFGVKVGTPGVTNGTEILQFNAGKGSSDIPFTFAITEPGLYPIRVIWYNGGGGANLEFFSYDANGNKIPVNDANNPAAIKAYYEVAGAAVPRITESTITAGNITIKWENGGTLEWAPAIDSTTWTTTGNSSGTFSEAVAAGNKFYRVKK